MLLDFPVIAEVIHTKIVQNVSQAEIAAEVVTLDLVEYYRLLRALEPLHQQYDPNESMLSMPLQRIGSHTTLEKGTIVHPTRDSLEYAVALFDTRNEELHQRAENTLRRIISLQDQALESSTYGIWPKFLEEPLEQMSPPDWNWADFLGTQLLQVSLEHRDRLSPDLASELDAAIWHAARSIQRRDVGLHYTNIAIMGTYVTLVAAETYEIPDLLDYALDRLRRFHAYTLSNGGFTEYNSPVYTTVSLRELGRLRLHVKNAEARKLVEELYLLTWQDIAEHFHAPSQQWAGPHSRNYSTLIDPRWLAVIDHSLEGAVTLSRANELPSLEAHRLPLPIPSHLIEFFTSLNQPRTVVKQLFNHQPKKILTTYLAPSFTLGTVNYSDMWNQRRSLIAYWGSSYRPSYLHMRFLRDGYDLATAQFFSVQDENRVLAGINFATDGGGRHPILDKIENATIMAKDLRLRFEFGGAAGITQLPVSDDFLSPVKLRIGGLNFQIVVPYARFGNFTPRWETSKGKSTSHLDIVLYSGLERSINLTDLEQAAIGLGLQISNEDLALPEMIQTQSDLSLELKWNQQRLKFLVKPDREEVLHQAFTVDQTK